MIYNQNGKSINYNVFYFSLEFGRAMVFGSDSIC